MSNHEQIAHLLRKPMSEFPTLLKRQHDPYLIYSITFKKIYTKFDPKVNLVNRSGQWARII